MKKVLIILAVLGFLIFCFLLFASDDDQAITQNEVRNKNNGIQKSEITIDIDYSTQMNRSYEMGFTSWPPGATIDDIVYMLEFINRNGDIIGHQFDNGLPWVEALENQQYPPQILEDWKTKKENSWPGRKIFLAIMPLNEARSDLAPYKNEKKKLPKSWKKLSFDDDQVKTAFLNYARESVRYFSPDYLCVGLEVNMILENAPEKWDSYVDFQKHVYSGLKKDFPGLPVFVSFEYNKMKGLGKTDKHHHNQELKKIMPYTDYLGLSVYPYGGDYSDTGRLEKIPDDFFDDALVYQKPIAVTESGTPSKSFKTYGINFSFDETYQAVFLNYMLKKAQQEDFVFVINWAGIDFDALLKTFPKKVYDLAVIWAYIGIVNNDRSHKLSYDVWHHYLGLPKE